jgi:hypothetical protein
MTNSLEKRWPDRPKLKLRPSEPHTDDKQASTGSFTTGINDLTEHQNRVFLQIMGLRQLSRTTGMITKRSQNTLLEALSDRDLAVVSLALAQHQEQFGW